MYNTSSSPGTSLLRSFTYCAAVVNTAAFMPARNAPSIFTCLSSAKKHSWGRRPYFWHRRSYMATSGLIRCSSEEMTHPSSREKISYLRMMPCTFFDQLVSPYRRKPFCLSCIRSGRIPSISPRMNSSKRS